MSEPFVGEIRMIGANFAPTGWAMCNGQLLPISQNTALFSLLGTFYGGDGKSNFALPNLQGRTPIHQGQGPGLSPRTIGSTGGVTAVTLAANQIPSHTHVANAVAAAGNQVGPSGHGTAEVRGGSYGSAPNAQMSAAAMAQVGGGQPHNNMPPYLVMNFIIALLGIFPSRT